MPLRSCAPMAPDDTPLGAAPLRGAARLSSALQETGFAVSEHAAGGAFCAAVRADIEALHAASLLQRSLNRVVTARQRAGGAAEAPSAAAPTPDEGHLCEKAGIHELDIVLNGTLVRPDALEAAPTLREWLGDSARGGSRDGGSRDGGGADPDGGAGTSAPTSGCAALLAQLNAAAPWLALTHLVRASAEALLARMPRALDTYAARRAMQDTLKVQCNEGIGGCFPMHYDTTPAISKRTLTAILCTYGQGLFRSHVATL